MLEMLRDLRLALAGDRFAQTRQPESCAEAGAEADLVDERERALLACDAPPRSSPEMMIAMAFQRIEIERRKAQAAKPPAGDKSKVR